MFEIVPAETSRFVEAVGPESDEVIAAMDRKADDEGFPTVGPAVGGWLQLLAELVDARRVFEFGSGFGYSAYWFARALPPDGEVVLTEVDADELHDAREFLERGGLADRARFEHGDAFDVVAEYDGPFDVVLVDCQKRRYADAFEAIRGKVADGGLLVADNAMTAGPIDFHGLLSVVEGGDPSGLDVETRGVADYLARVRADPAFETGVIPVGEGIAVSFKRGE